MVGLITDLLKLVSPIISPLPSPDSSPLKPAVMDCVPSQTTLHQSHRYIYLVGKISYTSQRSRVIATFASLMILRGSSSSKTLISWWLT